VNDLSVKTANYLTGVLVLVLVAVGLSGCKMFESSAVSPTQSNVILTDLNFIYSPPTSHCDFGCTVRFNVNTERRGKFMQLNFGDGQGVSGIVQNVEHTYFCHDLTNSSNGELCAFVAEVFVCPSLNRTDPRCGRDQATILLPALREGG
jgi:hypothetical protein